MNGGTALPAPWEPVRRVPLSGAAGVAVEARHPSGARHLHVGCDDPNKGFAAVLATPPRDGTGVAHVLEHLVGCASRRYPVRHVFFSMFPRSLQTYLNGITHPDTTLYTFATRHGRDYDNLLAVFLDAVFHPRLERLAFLQEAVRLEVEDGQPRWTGVVVNEMRGEQASPEAAMELAVGRALFPDLPYAHDHAGDLAALPGLTWEQARAFHAEHYRPANARFWSYGDVDLAGVLAAVDEALDGLDPGRPAPAVPLQAPFPEPRTVQWPYAARHGGDGARQVLVAWATAPVDDADEIAALQVLVEALDGTAAGPVRRALRAAGLGDGRSEGCGLATGHRQSWVGVGVAGVPADRVADVERVVLEAVAVPPSADELAAAVRRLELKARSLDNPPPPGVPRAVRLLFEARGPWAHGGDPVAAVDPVPALARLGRRAGDRSFWGGLVERWLRGNRHRALVVLEPDPGLDDRRRAAEAASAALALRALGPDGSARVAAATAELVAWQRGPEDTDVLPRLRAADLRVALAPEPRTELDDGGVRVALLPAATNGLVHAAVRLDASAADAADLALLPVLAAALAPDDPRADGRRGAVTVRAVPGPGPVGVAVTFAADARAEDATAVVDVLAGLLTATDVAPARAAVAARDVLSGWDAAAGHRGLVLAAMRAAASANRAGRLADGTEGLGARDDLEALPDDPAAVADRLGRLATALLRPGAVTVCLTAEPAALAVLEGSLPALGSCLARSSGAGPGPGLAAVVPRAELRTARLVPGRVAHNARSHAVAGRDHDDAPALHVLASCLTLRLHAAVREQGGAYGALAHFDGERGLFHLASFRDPNVAATYRAFDRVVADAAAGVTAAEVEAGVVSAFGRIDRLDSPATRGSTQVIDDLEGFGLERRRRLAEGVLAVGPDDVARVAATWLGDGTARWCTVGPEEMVAAAAADLGVTFAVDGRPVPAAA